MGLKWKWGQSELTPYFFGNWFKGIEERNECLFGQSSEMMLLRLYRSNHKITKRHKRDIRGQISGDSLLNWISGDSLLNWISGDSLLNLISGDSLLNCNSRDSHLKLSVLRKLSPECPTEETHGCPRSFTRSLAFPPR
jgi:hypothetical protein